MRGLSDAPVIKNRRNYKRLKSLLFAIKEEIMKDVQCCFIKEKYFKEHTDFVNMLDPNNFDKQSKRTHLCVMVNINNNQVFVPLRNNLGEPLRKFGKIGFPVPSAKRPNAGLDYRYCLIVNDDNYIEWHKDVKLPNAQLSIIKKNYETIVNEVHTYIGKYIKVARKHREKKEPLFKQSSLMNFHKELGL